MADTIFRVLKITVIIAVVGVFMVAINTIFGLIASLTFGNVIGEVLGIISCCLPFNAVAVFASLANAIVAILAFMVARKIFDLTSWSISSI